GWVGGGGMREIVLDTETTGLDPEDGHRIVEIACLELVNHVPSGRVFHRHVNPEREVPEDAYAVHGHTTEFLAGFPPFAALAAELELIGGRQPGFDLVAELVEHSPLLALSRMTRPPRPHQPLPEELAAHVAMLALLKQPLWLAEG